MRDTIKSKEYFDEYILKMSEGIKRFEEGIAAGKYLNDKILFVKDYILQKKIGIIIAKYSKGDSIEEIKKEFECRPIIIKKGRFNGSITLGWKYELLDVKSGKLSTKLKLTKNESSIMKLATSPCLKIFVLLSFSKPVISFDNRLETIRLSSQG